MQTYSTGSGNLPAIPAIATTRRKGRPHSCFPVKPRPAGRTAAEIFPPLAVRDVTMIDPSLSPTARLPRPCRPGPPLVSPTPTPVVLPSVDDVFNKYAQALGGDAAISKIKSLAEKGMVEMMVPPPPGPPGTPAVAPMMGTVSAEIYRKLPSKAVLSVQFPGRPPTIVGDDGTIGWTNAPLREITGGELALQQGIR